MSLDPVLTPLVQAVLAALVSLFLGTATALVGALVKKALAEEAQIKHNLGDAQFTLLQAFVDVAIREAEQLGVVQELKDKKAYAVSVVQKLADQYHIPVDVATVESLIESAIRMGLHLPDEAPVDPPAEG